MYLNMEKIKVVILSDNIDYRLKLREYICSDDMIISGYVGYDENAILKIRGLSPDVLLITYEKNNESTFEICSNIYCSLQGCAIILITSDLSVDLVTRAMSNGVRKVLDEKSCKEQLADSIRYSYQLEKSRLGDKYKSGSRNSKVVSFFGGKGGTGKTTIAINTATALAKEGKKVLVLDFDLQFGDVNLHLNIEPKETISELIDEGGDMTIDSIKGYIMVHGSGVNVLCAPKSPEYAEYVTAGHVEKIINIVRPYYDYVIIDLPPAFNDQSIASVENSDNVYLVFGMDISSLKNAKLCLNIMESLQQKDKVGIIINGVVDSIIKIKDFENTLSVNVIGSICRDTKNAVASLNKGIPIVLSSPKLQMSKEIAVIAKKISES